CQRSQLTCDGATPRSRISSSRPRRISTRVALGPSCTPAPTSPKRGARSMVYTSKPACSSNAVAANPPIPAPTMRILATAGLLTCPRPYDAKPTYDFSHHYRLLGTYPRNGSRVRSTGRRTENAAAARAIEREPPPAGVGSRTTPTSHRTMVNRRNPVADHRLCGTGDFAQGGAPTRRIHGEHIPVELGSVEADPVGLVAGWDGSGDVDPATVPTAPHWKLVVFP